MELKIPEAKYYLSTDTFEITCSPASQRELDIYTPLLMLEWWIYPKKFIQKIKIHLVAFPLRYMYIYMWSIYIAYS